VIERQSESRGSKRVKALSGTCVPLEDLHKYFQRIRILLELRIDFHDHVILIELGKIVETWRWPKAS